MRVAGYNNDRKEADLVMFNRIERWFGNGAFGLVELLITAFCVFLSLSIHEFSHGYAAYKMGDSTAKNMGRLNISPVSHIDPIGALCLFLFGFGWAKPVPVNPRNFAQKKYKIGMVLTSIAGPLSNLLLAFVSYFLFRLILNFDMSENLFAVLSIMFSTLTIMNISLAIFNLFPVPPLDGSKILNAVLPARLYFKIMEYEQYGFIILIILINMPFFGRFMSFVVYGLLDFYDMILDLIPFL